MKKICYLMTLLAVVLLASCESKKPSANLVPDDAAVVFRIDLMQSADKLGISGGNSGLASRVKDIVSDLGLNRAQQKKIEQVLDDPTSTGIDLTDPLYFFLAGNIERNPDGGLVGTLASESDFEELLNTLAEDQLDKVEKRNGVSFCGDDDFCIIFADGWFYLGSNHDTDETIAQLKERAEGKGSLAASKAFQTMDSKKGLVQMLVMGKRLADIRDFRKAINALPEGLDLADVSWVSDLIVEKGETMFTCENVALSGEWEEYIASTLKALGTIDKSQAKYISDRGFSAFANIDTDALARWIEKIAQAGGASRNDIKEVKQVCKALSGTAAFDIYGFSTGGPLFTAYIGTKDNTIVDMIKGLAGDEELEETGNNAYRLPVAYDYNWDDYSRVPSRWGSLGFKSGQTYFAMEEDEVFRTPENKYPTADLKGKGIYMRFNFEFLNSIAEELWGSGAEIADEVANVFDYAEYYVEEEGAGVLRLVNKNKRKTIFDIISDEVKKFGDDF